ncbi:RNA methyltransferase [Loigolactobacillus coryniformis subsp. coryniformis]|uniref:RNA methyltransferase n=1 Tax=Loigolactobacillus coryniformis subsp. coryniformis KCTC 3167 = DSM 20001 TaxID=913848 RepID=A0A0R1F2L7_9LACO|nr:23S rRNA (uracil(1939)-C(5))-methyltransferase RlmD [Loigolactobacillus coryniformis]ATO54706.1 23S rRNA (uracil-5-)-methyltransferase RumA [Loigolactobacillus coryniformis subsp. coryniformis KCTC 3167 = DSM 20001]KRK14467.1 RNA methyltransferase [Loigolactobacillus coryniformis subsp. coryniformis KCTC 3167 = DSM 20001]OEH90906.1 RNA methyltransferase [Loigolactobacillus coryniformis subsp. coryniformis]
MPEITYFHDIQVGQRFPLTIKRLGINGEGIGYYKRTIVFVKGALPDEVIVVEVTATAPKYVNAKIHTLRKKSPQRVEPRDADYYGHVGGIELEHLSYPAQLAFKVDVIRQSLEKFKPRGYQHYKLLPTIGMAEPYEYRNKAQFQVRELNGHVAAGLYQEHSHQLVDLKTFSTQRPATMQVIRYVVALLEELKVPIYNEEQNSGIVKTLVVRESFSTGHLQLTFITNSRKLPHKRELLSRIHTKMPQITSIMQNLNQGRTSLIWGEETFNLAGDDYITETLSGLTFKLSARAFFQLNPAQTAKMYALAREALQLAPHESLVDAYCGVGTIGLSLADTASEVRGMDIVPAAIADAQENANLNHIDNAKYEVGKAEELLPQWLAAGFAPDALVVDPPRTGLDQALLHAILDSRPQKFVYISCNPSTLARDLVRLSEVYAVDYIQSIDMFPQTARVEAVVRLEKRNIYR